MFCFFWCKHDQNPFRNDFTIFFGKNVVLYEIYSVKSRVANTYVHWLYIFLWFKDNFLFSDVKFAIYLTKIKSEKSTFVLLLSDKQIKFKEFCASWNKCHKSLPRDSFKIFVWKNGLRYCLTHGIFLVYLLQSKCTLSDGDVKAILIKRHKLIQRILRVLK
jgi:hypothetical protein